MKGSLQRKLKGASVWPFNARSRSAYKLKSTVSPRTGLIFWYKLSSLKRFFIQKLAWEGVPGLHPHAKFHRCGFKNVGLQPPPKSRKMVILSRVRSVCLSVRPSVRYVPVLYENGLTYCQFFYHTVAQSFYFYQHQTSSRNSDGVTTCGGTKYRWGIKISRLWISNSLCRANDTR